MCGCNGISALFGDYMNDKLQVNYKQHTKLEVKIYSKHIRDSNCSQKGVLYPWSIPFREKQKQSLTMAVG